jgi:hypothetical protein
LRQSYSRDSSADARGDWDLLERLDRRDDRPVLFEHKAEYKDDAPPFAVSGARKSAEDIEEEVHFASTHVHDRLPLYL